MDILKLCHKLYQLALALRKQIELKCNQKSYHPKLQLINICLDECIYKQYQTYCNMHEIDEEMNHFICDDSLNGRDFKISIRDKNLDVVYEYKNSCETIMLLDINNINKLAEEYNI